MCSCLSYRNIYEWVRDCLMPTQQFFSFIMTRIIVFSNRWWWGLLCTRTTRLVDLHCASSLKQLSADRHFAPLGHIILIPNQQVIDMCPYCCVLSGEATITFLLLDPIGTRTHDPPPSRGEYANHYTTDAIETLM